MELENKHVKETVINMFYMLQRIEKNMTVMKKEIETQESPRWNF